MKFLLYIIIPILLFANNFEKSENIVIDKTNHIMWQDNLESTQYIDNITMAKTYCEDLILNGYTNWELATIKQLESIIDVTKKNVAIKKEFQYTTATVYWSKTPYVKDKNKFWFVDFRIGSVNFGSKNQKFTLRCVRDIK